MTELSSIRNRDADFGKDIPSHWQAQIDRRALLRLLDKALEKKEVGDGQEIPR